MESNPGLQQSASESNYSNTNAAMYPMLQNSPDRKIPYGAGGVQQPPMLATNLPLNHYHQGHPSNGNNVNFSPMTSSLQGTGGNVMMDNTRSPQRPVGVVTMNPSFNRQVINNVNNYNMNMMMMNNSNNKNPMFHSYGGYNSQNSYNLSSNYGGNGNSFHSLSNHDAKSADNAQRIDKASPTAAEGSVREKKRASSLPQINGIPKASSADFSKSKRDSNPKRVQSNRIGSNASEKNKNRNNHNNSSSPGKDAKKGHRRPAGKESVKDKNKARTLSALRASSKMHLNDDKNDDNQDKDNKDNELYYDYGDLDVEADDDVGRAKRGGKLRKMLSTKFSSLDSKKCGSAAEKKAKREEKEDEKEKGKTKKDREATTASSHSKRKSNEIRLEENCVATIHSTNPENAQQYGTGGYFSPLGGLYHPLMGNGPFMNGNYNRVVSNPLFQEMFMRQREFYEYYKNKNNNNINNNSNLNNTNIDDHYNLESSSILNGTYNSENNEVNSSLFNLDGAMQTKGNDAHAGGDDPDDANRDVSEDNKSNFSFESFSSLFAVNDENDSDDEYNDEDYKDNTSSSSFYDMNVNVKQISRQHGEHDSVPRSATTTSSQNHYKFDIVEEYGKLYQLDKEDVGDYYIDDVASPSSPFLANMNLNETRAATFNTADTSKNVTGAGKRSDVNNDKRDTMKTLQDEYCLDFLNDDYTGAQGVTDPNRQNMNYYNNNNFNNNMQPIYGNNFGNYNNYNNMKMWRSMGNNNNNPTGNNMHYNYDPNVMMKMMYFNNNPKYNALFQRNQMLLMRHPLYSSMMATARAAHQRSNGNQKFQQQQQQQMMAMHQQQQQQQQQMEQENNVQQSVPPQRQPFPPKQLNPQSYPNRYNVDVIASTTSMPIPTTSPNKNNNNSYNNSNINNNSEVSQTASFGENLHGTSRPESPPPKTIYRENAFRSPDQRPSFVLANEHADLDTQQRKAVRKKMKNSSASTAYDEAVDVFGESLVREDSFSRPPSSNGEKRVGMYFSNRSSFNSVRNFVNTESVGVNDDLKDSTLQGSGNNIKYKKSTDPLVKSKKGLRIQKEMQMLNNNIKSVLVLDPSVVGDERHLIELIPQKGNADSQDKSKDQNNNNNFNHNIEDGSEQTNTASPTNKCNNTLVRVIRPPPLSTLATMTGLGSFAAAPNLNARATPSTEPMQDFTFNEVLSPVPLLSSTNDTNTNGKTINSSGSGSKRSKSKSDSGKAANNEYNYFSSQIIQDARNVFVYGCNTSLLLADVDINQGLRGNRGMPNSFALPSNWSSWNMVKQLVKSAFEGFSKIYFEFTISISLLQEDEVLDLLAEEIESASSNTSATDNPDRGSRFKPLQVSESPLFGYVPDGMLYISVDSSAEFNDILDSSLLRANKYHRGVNSGSNRPSNAAQTTPSPLKPGEDENGIILLMCILKQIKPSPNGTAALNDPQHKEIRKYIADCNRKGKAVNLCNSEDERYNLEGSYNEKGKDGKNNGKKNARENFADDYDLVVSSLFVSAVGSGIIHYTRILDKNPAEPRVLFQFVLFRSVHSNVLFTLVDSRQTTRAITGGGSNTTSSEAVNKAAREVYKTLTTLQRIGEVRLRKPWRGNVRVFVRNSKKKILSIESGMELVPSGKAKIRQIQFLERLELMSLDAEELLQNCIQTPLKTYLLHIQ